MIKRHGNKQIDYSCYFDLSNENPKENYEIDLWFFIPSSLNNSDYSYKEFFTDFTTYTRYNAHDLQLSELSDFFNPKNPLTRIQSINHDIDNIQEVEYELKTLLNTLKYSSTKVISTLNGMKAFSPFEAEQNLVIQIARFNLIFEKLIMLNSKAPKDFLNIYNLALEGVSLRIEKTLYKLYKLLPNSNVIIIKEINNQRDFRTSMGFNSVTTTDEKVNSETIHREHIIKKWAESIMYINLENSKTQKGMSHVFLGSAAAIAMLITGVLSLIVATVWGDDKIYWFITLLVAYSLKDRIKDMLKSLFLKKMNRFFSDRIQNIASPVNRRHCGRSMERVTFPSHNDLDKDLKSLRFTRNDDISIKRYQEDIIHYKKTVTVKTKKLYKNHTRLFGIKEIMRLDLRRWFYKMDKNIEKCYIPIGDSLEQVQGDREYHFNVIIRKKIDSAVSLERYRIVATNHKIKKVYEIHS